MAQWLCILSKGSTNSLYLHHVALHLQQEYSSAMAAYHHTPVTHSTVSSSEGRSETTASVVYKSYPESRKALHKLEGKVFKGGTYMSMLVTCLFDGIWIQ